MNQFMKELEKLKSVLVAEKQSALDAVEFRFKAKFDALAVLMDDAGDWPFERTVPKRKYARFSRGGVEMVAAPDEKPNLLKPGRKPAQTAAEAEKAVDDMLGGDAPEHFGGAIKRVLREAPGGLTVDGMFDAVERQWPSLVVGKSRDSIIPNVGYWVSKGYVAQGGMGALARYKVVDADFFAEPSE